ncbi:acyl-CoA dehydrogenase family protein [Nocardioides sp. P86]|uniref:acyl-CoA dehydrogenase family protein n=1 Tax=Nocardioides sp. P86 TaxID=2939569 RepID=UPI002040E424|nr:acyl-CoA dehydrogenase family protein [Nocardioides sp. P86]MCM3516642.1 acyl-CoA/acyl-ACP dehydrogenase [Nocardioides sp. P86]
MPDLKLSHSPLIPETEERRALRESVAALAGKYGRAYFQEAAARGGFPDELYRDLGHAGFLGVNMPEEWGGGGGGLADLAVVIEECAAQGCPMQMIVISSITASIIARHGSEVLKERWLEGICSGEKKVVFAITEPDAGTNTHNISTTATPSPGGGWTLTGQKYWTSGVDEADAVMVVARDAEPGPDGKRTLSLFLIPTDAPGFSYTVIDSALRAPERQFVTFYDDVPVAADSIVGDQGRGLQQVFAGLNPERVAAAAIASGIALYALQRGALYANQRTVWSQPIGAHQGLSHPLAKAYIDVQQARLMNFRAAELYDTGQDAACAEAANIAKLAAADACLLSLDQAMQTHGGNGLSNEYGLSDLWFTARMLKTAPVSREMVLNYVAQHSLGLPKSY